MAANTEPQRRVAAAAAPRRGRRGARGIRSRPGRDAV